MLFTSSVAVAKEKADRTAYDVGIAAEPNRRKCRVWNNNGQMTTLPIAIPDTKNSAAAVRFFAVCCG